MWFFNKKKALEIQKEAVARIVGEIVDKVDVEIIKLNAERHVQKEVINMFMADEHYFVGIRKEIKEDLSAALIEQATNKFLNDMSDKELRSFIQDGIRDRVKKGLKGLFS